MMRIPTVTQFQHQADAISQQFNQVSQIQQQVESQQKIIHSSDDPVLGLQIKSTNDLIKQLQSYTNNQTLTQGRSQLFQQSIQNAMNTISNITTLIVNAQNGTLNNSDRGSIAKELQGDMTALLNIANTKDVNGEYIFGGFNSNTPPFIQTSTGYQYQGSLDPTYVNIGINASVLYNESGFNVFGNIPNGNGTFTVTASPSNVGSASTSAGSIASNGSYVPDTYTLSFVTNGSGQLAYQVVGTSSGQVIPAPPASTPTDAPQYIPGSDINFNGITINIDGAATAGDSFQIAPSTNQNIFNTLQSAINVLQNPPANQGMFNQELSQASASFNQVNSHMTNYLSEVGTNSAFINDQITANTNQITNQTVILSGLSDVDFPAVVSQLMQQSIALQATQESYIQIQNLMMKLLQL